MFAPQLETTIALQDASFNVDPGELVGYIGADISTTIKILTGIPALSGSMVRVLVRHLHHHVRPHRSLHRQTPAQFLVSLAMPREKV